MTWQTLVRFVMTSASVVAAVAVAAAVACWRTLRPVLLAVSQVLLALIVIFEEWGWQPLAAALGWLARFRPVAAVERWLAGLPPYGALAVFALPVTLLFPLKLVAVWLLAQGHVLLAGSLFIAAKIASTAFIARIFMLTKPALMQIGWFARAYAWFVPWEEAAMHWLRSSWAWRWGRIAKYKAEKSARAFWAAAKPRVQVLADRVRRQWSRVGPRLQQAARLAFVEARARTAQILKRLTGGRAL